MKKILLTFLLLLSSFSFAFAENSLEIDLSKSEIYIDESFALNIHMSIDKNTTHPLSIEWINNFKQFWNQTSQNISIINGEQRATTTLSLSFYPTQTGSFTIWPAQIKIGEELITSNTVVLNILDINNISQKEEKNDENDKKDALLEDILEDSIHAVEKNIFSFLDFNYFIFIVFFLLGVVFYLFKKFYGEKESSKNIVEPVERVSPEKQKSLLIKKLYQLQEQYEGLSKSEFYNTLNSVFKDYFGYLLEEDVTHLTYEEIKERKIDKRLLNLFEKSYFSEFNNEDDTMKIRGKMIDDLLNKINK